MDNYFDALNKCFIQRIEVFTSPGSLIQVTIVLLNAKHLDKEMDLMFEIKELNFDFYR